MNTKSRISVKAIREIGQLSNDGVCIVDLANQNFKYFNKGLIEILDTSKDELMANPFEVIKQRLEHDQEYASRQLSEMKSKRKAQNVEFRLRSDLGEKFIEVDAFILEDSALLIAIVKDVTNSKQHFNYIVEFGARKDALLDMIAHNLSGPLNLTTDLLNAIDQTNKRQHYKKIDTYSRLIRESTQQCVEIINSFLDEEHSESERVFVKNNLFDVRQKVEIVVERLKQFNHDKKFTIISNKDEVMVSADDVKVFQIIHNLLSNAVKFTSGHGEITVHINDYEHFFDLRVTDTGIGIPEHLHPYIFQRNTPASREGLKGEKSIGMGLYIVKKLADMMHGSVTFKSAENAGTSFLLRMPKE